MVELQHHWIWLSALDARMLAQELQDGLCRSAARQPPAAPVALKVRRFLANVMSTRSFTATAAALRP
jgi:hypothetical protein